MNDGRSGDDAPLCPSSIEEIDRRCDEFEAAWKEGRKPLVEDFLQDSTEPQLPRLLKELIALEIDYRRGVGESVSVVEYEKRFPAYVDAIRSLFVRGGETTSFMISASDRTLTASPGRVVNDRYCLLGKLGEGGMAKVYRAHDLQEDRNVALKVMKTALSGTGKKRFAREFRAATGVEHVNCIKVYEFGEIGERPFFTMELFESSHFNSLVGEELSVILAVIDQAAAALDFVHQRRIIHRDVKPSNLLVRADSQASREAFEWQVRLTDFGLARFYGIPSSLSVESGFVGSLAYAAPEQIAAHRIDHRIDLYAFGVVCYEVLTGQYPFEEARRNSMQTLMRAHLSEHPPSMRSLNPSIPNNLEDVVLAYLQKDPASRPHSMALLRRVISAYLGRDTDAATDESETSTATKTRADGYVIARAAELGHLDKLLRGSLSPAFLTHREWAQSPIPSIVFISGEAGIGKSYLLNELRRTAERQGATVFEGRCFKGTPAPYHPFVDIVRQMLVLEKDDSGTNRIERRAVEHRGGAEDTGLHEDVHKSPQKETLSGLIRYYAAELLRIAPDLRQQLPGEAFRQVDLNRETNYVMRAVATFFVEVGTLRGICLFIEDIQWADLSTLDLLRHLTALLFRNRERSIESNHSFPRLFICCTVRSGEAGSGEFPFELQRDRYGQIVQLSALSLDESRELICRRLGTSTDEANSKLIEQLHEQCHGNPYFISESVREWCNTGRIIQTDSGWQLDESRDEDSAWPDSVRDVLRGRLETISAIAQRTLSCCAVIGSVVSVNTLRNVLGDMSEDEFLDAVDELLARQILFERADSTSLEFSHDLLRELTYERLSGNRRRALHGRIGKVLEVAGTGQSSPELLADHFYQARAVEPAFTFLIAAGEAALASYAADDALRHLRRASEFETEVSDRVRKLRLQELLATAYSATGRAEEAIACHQRQLELTADHIEKGRVLEGLGKLHFRIGDFDSAVSVFDEALRQVGYRRPRSNFGVVLSTAMSFIRHTRPNWSRFRGLGCRRREERTIAHGVYSTLELLSAQRNVLQCGQAHGRHLVLADQIGDLSFLTHACARQALIFGIFSVNGLAIRAGRRALAYARQAGDNDAEAIAKGHVGCAHYFGGRLKEAERLLRDAVRVLDRRGDSWERMYFYHNLRHLYSIVGDAEREIESAKVEMQIGEAVHDPEGNCWGAYGIANALARSGQLEDSHRYMQRAWGILSGRTNIVVVPTALQTYGFVHLQSSDYAAAQEVLEESCKNIDRDWAFIEYTVRAYPLLAESLLGPHWHDRPAQADREVIRRSWKVSGKARFWAWRFPNYSPHALRVRGRAAWAIGNPKKAIQCFKSAIRAAEHLGARYDQARACIDLARLNVEGRQEFADRGRELLRELGAVVPAAEE